MNDNRLIAEFMGAVGTPKYSPTEWDVYITGCLDVDSDEENAQHFYTPDKMKYHKSWDWLMPVVIKCMQTRGDADKWDHLYNALSGLNIDELYKAVVEFIKDQNLKQNKPLKLSGEMIEIPIEKIDSDE